jgi:hypothetical protein
MLHNLDVVITWINRQNAAIIIFLLCMANYFGITPEGGEEQYFAFAKQFMDPLWMPQSFALNHPAGGNLAFQVIVGFLLKYISFEQMVVLGRTVNFLLYALPLSLIFKKLKISNIEIIFLLQAVFFGHQSLYAGEWIFKNFEEKSLAYVFVFWSIYYLLNEKIVLCSVFAAMATWFHFLVGGWMFCFVFLYFLLRRRKISDMLLMGIAFVLLTGPLMVYLFQTYMINNPPVVNGINTNIIYAFWRLKHHIGMFSDFHYFITNTLWGVMITMILFAFCVFKFSKIRNHPVIGQLNTLNIIIFSQQFLFMIIAIFDKNGELMKTYPFRTNSISLLLFLLELTLILKIYLPVKLYKPLVLKYFSPKNLAERKNIFSMSMNTLLLMISLPVFIFETTQTMINARSYHGDLDENMIKLIEYVKENTPGSSVFIFPDGDRPYAFIRMAERERFVVNKFTPTKSAAIYEWYQRSLLKEALRKDISLIDSIKTSYKVNYLVSDSLYSYTGIILEKKFGSHNLYRIRD